MPRHASGGRLRSLSLTSQDASRVRPLDSVYQTRGRCQTRTETLREGDTETPVYLKTGQEIDRQKTSTQYRVVMCLK